MTAYEMAFKIALLVVEDSKCGKRYSGTAISMYNIAFNMMETDKM